MPMSCVTNPSLPPPFGPPSGEEARRGTEQGHPRTGSEPLEGIAKGSVAGVLPRAGLLPEVLRGDPVHPVLELVHDLFFGGFFHRFLEDYRGFFEYHVGGKDGGPGANSDRDGVRGPRVNLDGAAVHLHVQGRKEGRVPECGDGYPLQSTAELGNEVDGEVVGEGPAELLVLELHKDGAGLRLADPDRQVAILVLDLEDYYGARAKEVQVDPVDGHLGEAIGAH